MHGHMNVKLSNNCTYLWVFNIGTSDYADRIQINKLKLYQLIKRL
jgi:hypothetical protein